MKKRLLLVDDEPSILHALQRELQRHPYEVLTAESGDEALALLASNAVQVILSDHQMPGMSGVELLAEVAERYPQTIRMLLSGHSDFDALIDAVNTGGLFKFLRKPWDTGQIAQVVGMAFAQFDLVQSAAVFARIFADTDEGIVIVQNNGVIVAANPAFCAMTGYATDQLDGQTLASLGAADTPALTATAHWADAISAALAQQADEDQCSTTSWHEELWLQRKDGSCFPIAASLSALHDPKGRITQHVLLCNDITERKQREVALLESEKRFRDFMEFAPIGMAIIGLDGELLKVNQSLCSILDYEREELEHQRFETLAHPDDLAADLASRRQLLTGDLTSWHAERRYQRKHGELVWVQVTAAVLRDTQGQAQCFDVQIEDISERRAQQEQIRQLAYYDVLTGLPNRRLLIDRLEQTLSQSRRSGRLAAVIFVDLDHFKEVNDIHGHDAGDDLLRLAAERLQACVRHVDTVSRQGGDEFVLILSEVNDVQGAIRVAEKIVASIGQPYELHLRQLRLNTITASVGIALYPLDGSDAETLMKHADNAMYQAKESGRNGYRCYVPEHATEPSA